MSHFQRDGFRTIDYTLSKPLTRKLKKTWQAFTQNIPAYPDTFDGRGIVMCAGGLKYFTCGWIAIKMLRETGCTLPVELWYLGNELSNDAIKEIEKYNVTCRNFLDDDRTSLNGCMLKPLAIIKSSFKEIFFLDADNVVLKDPERFFETKVYKEYGAIFWPDFWKTPQDNPIWDITGTAYTETYEQESGQMLINKEKCWEALNLSLHFNILNEVYYTLLMGDKDTFRFAWLALKQPYYMITEPVAICGYQHQEKFLGTTMVQHDIDGEICFLHRNLIKWDITHAEELCWQKIQRFRKDANERIYILDHSVNAHRYMAFDGDYEMVPFDNDLEKRCLVFLEELRSMKFYQQFLLYSHFATTRYRPTTQFELA